jgi:Tol biopolymer transport system component
VVLEWNYTPAISVMNADGTNYKQLTSVHDLSPSWSPDGTKIVFHSERPGSYSQIYMMNSDGTNQTRLTSNQGVDTDPDWGPRK